MLHDPLFFGVFVFAGRRGELLAPKNLRQRSVKRCRKKPGNQSDSPEAVWFQCFLAYQVKYRTNRIAVSTQDPG
ncbi:Uncharacterised protein [uncultured Clostridium sp.]|nr:Uncharacterised protein [uncultured Clostridium sp.]